MGYRIVDDLEHPDITAIRKFGYPMNYLPVEQWCEECGCEIEGEAYEDESHDCLCLDCLLTLHKRELYQ